MQAAMSGVLVVVMDVTDACWHTIRLARRPHAQIQDILRSVRVQVGGRSSKESEIPL
jgi:hypothetical protein